MDKASLSPSSLTKQCFGDSADDDCEVLTPGQGVKTPEPAPPTTRGGAEAPSETQPPPSDTAASTDSTNPPASKVPRMDAEYVNARFGDYMRRSERKKDYKGKAKNSSRKESSPLASQSGIGTPAPEAASIPSTPYQYTQASHFNAAPQNTGMVPPPNSMPWGVGGPYSGSQGLPNFSGFNYSMPQHPAVPPWLHSQWTAAMPYLGLGVAPPPMDRHWSFNQPQHG